MVNKNRAKPIFSVILPTYNRCQDIPFAIKSVLKQDLSEFEFLILDDASTDNTEAVVKSFADKRIRYIKNHKNITVARNVINGFNIALGKYIFTLGDDDIILRNDTFSYIFKKMEEKKAGFGQIGLMYCDKKYSEPCFLDHVASKLKYIPPSKKILIKTLNWHFGFLSGNIFRKDLILKSDLINDIWWMYFRVIFRSIASHGCIYFGNYFIVAKISSTGNISYVDIKKNKQFHLKKLFEIYTLFDKSRTRFEQFKKAKLDIVIRTLIGIKYYTSNDNIRRIAREIIGYRSQYIYDFSYWFNYLFALLTPKFILRVMRYLRIKIGTIKMRQFARITKIDKFLIGLTDNEKKISYRPESI